jgi:hypothetical protein
VLDAGYIALKGHRRHRKEQRPPLVQLVLHVVFSQGQAARSISRVFSGPCCRVCFESGGFGAGARRNPWPCDEDRNLFLFLVLDLLRRPTLNVLDSFVFKSFWSSLDHSPSAESSNSDSSSSNKLNMSEIASLLGTLQQREWIQAENELLRASRWR